MSAESFNQHAKTFNVDVFWNVVVFRLMFAENKNLHVIISCYNFLVFYF